MGMTTTPVNATATRLADILAKNEEEVLADWLKEMSGSTRRSDLIKESELRNQCSQLFKMVKQATEKAGPNFQSPAFDPTRDLLAEISRTRAQQGFKPSETATFVLSLKPALFKQIQAHGPPYNGGVSEDA
jgi:rsbT co-antagonist protein RsbR